MTADAAPETAVAERGERIAKWLARAGVASRRDAERMLGEGRVRLNNAPVTHPATFVTKGDIVRIDGTVVEEPDRTRLWRYHKPPGLVTTHRDPQGRPTVFEKLRETLPRVVSVGRLDLNSEGLLLLTNDGGLARRLELPATGWLRRYRVRVHGPADERALAALGRGIAVDAVRYGPIEAGLDSRKGDNAWLTVALREGRNREVRRVMEHLGLRVTRLIRVAYGPFQLGTLPRGEADEVQARVLRDQLPATAAAPNGCADPMRIVGGEWRGKKLAGPSGQATRPTADRVRQALFDMLLHAPWGGRDLLAGARVLDAFAGTGALGLEALSRGAAHASFIERDRETLAVLRRNISGCGASGRSTILEADVLAAPPGTPCSLLLLDPPYGKDLLARAMGRLRQFGWVAPGAIVAAESGRDAPAAEDVLAERSHGAARLTIWREP